MSAVPVHPVRRVPGPGWALGTVALGLAGATALGRMGGISWPLDLLSHFPLQLGLAALGLACIAAARGAVLWMLVAAAVVLANAMTLRMPAGEEAPAGAARLRVAMANLSLTNRNGFLPDALMAGRDPDVLGFAEVNARWVADLDAALQSHPHRLVASREHHFGIALYSRLPFESSETRLLGGDPHHPALLARVRVAGKPVQLMVAHPHPPLTAFVASLRDRQLAELSRIRQEKPGPFVLLGDLNATPWSQAFARLLHSSGLRDSRAGHGQQATWPASLGLMGLPLDHILISSDWIVTRRNVGVGVGSDHRPVFAELSFRP
ncbi:MAG: endonuclease/exonuclease/phosphatase family protein [bacterium]|nr:endonuclease/exonuclease/phosphatase family protein [bacterium]